MITRIEIDGFKSFHDFAVDLRPFQVFIGANASGKSNFFDALLLLSKLATANRLYEAFRDVRGNVVDLFSLLPDGTRAKKMRFAVEVLIPKIVKDDLEKIAELKTNRWRYELEISRQDENGTDTLVVMQEYLTNLLRENDTWVSELKDFATNWVAYTEEQADYPLVGISPADDQTSIFPDSVPSFIHPKRTILSAMTTVENPEMYAVRHEMESWCCFQFDPAALRIESSYNTVETLSSNGDNLPTALHRMQQKYDFVLTDVSRDMANLVPGISEIRIEDLPHRGAYTIVTSMYDGTSFYPDLLSDGTLRLLGLVTLANNPDFEGLVCIEEPENGVHPNQLAYISKRLRDMMTDFSLNPSEDNLLRQVFITTHSPHLLAQFEPENFQYVYMPRTTPAKTRMTSLVADDGEALNAYTRLQIRQFLNTAPVVEMSEEVIPE